MFMKDEMVTQRVEELEGKELQTVGIWRESFRLLDQNQM